MKAVPLFFNQFLVRAFSSSVGASSARYLPKKWLKIPKLNMVLAIIAMPSSSRPLHFTRSVAWAILLHRVYPRHVIPTSSCYANPAFQRGSLVRAVSNRDRSVYSIYYLWLRAWLHPSSMGWRMGRTRCQK